MKTSEWLGTTAERPFSEFVNEWINTTGIILFFKNFFLFETN